MRISDWSSDVCSSDLISVVGPGRHGASRRSDGRRRSRQVRARDAGEDRHAGRTGDAPPPAALQSPLLIRQLLGGLLFLPLRSEEHTSELQSLMRISYVVFCLKKKKQYKTQNE